MSKKKLNRMEALKALTDEYQRYCHLGLGGCYCSQNIGTRLYLEDETRLSVEDCVALFWVHFDKEFPKRLKNRASPGGDNGTKRYLEGSMEPRGLCD